MSNIEYTICEDYTLPSKARIYKNSFDPRIKLRSMTVRDEMKRTSNSQYIYKNLCEIIDDCLLTKLPISCYDMCMADYEYLLHKLRVVTYGPEYKMVVGCPHCDAVYNSKIDLDSLKIKDYDEDKFNELLSFELPASKRNIKLKIKTPRIADNIDFKIKEFKKENPNFNLDPTPLIKLQEMIDTVDGRKLGYAEMENYVNALSARDYNYIINKIDAASAFFGLDTKLNLTCDKCGGNILTFFRFGPEFFRPKED